MKRNLFIRVSVLALLIAVPHFAQGATVIVNGADQTISTDPAAAPSIQFMTNNIAQVDPMVNITGSVDTAFDSTGILAFLGTSTITGSVGTSTNSLRQVIAGLGVVDTDTFIGDVYAGALSVGSGTVDLNGNFSGSVTIPGTIEYNGDGTVKLENGKSITGTVATQTNNTGTLELVGNGTVNGGIGIAGTSLKEVKAGAAGAVANLNGNIYAQTLTVSGSGTVGLNGNFTGTTLNYAGDGIVSLADGKTIAAAVTTATDGTGTLEFVGGGVMNGQIGTSTAALSTVKGGQSLVDGLSINGNVYAGTLDIGIGSVLVSGDVQGDVVFSSLTGDTGYLVLGAGKSVYGNVTTNMANSGTLQLSDTVTGGNIGTAAASLKAVGFMGGTSYLNDDIYAGTTSIAGGATLVALGGVTHSINGNLSNGGTLDAASGAVTAGTPILGVDGNITNTGTIHLGQNQVAVTGILTSGAGSTITTDVAYTAGVVSGGVINLGGTGTANIDGAAVNVTSASAFIPNGTKFKLIQNAAGGAISFVGTTVTDALTTVDFTLLLSGSDLELVATSLLAPGTGLATTVNAQNVEAAINAIGAGASADMATIQAAIGTSATTDEYNNILELLSGADVLSSSIQVADTFTNKAQGVMNTRLGGSHDNANGSTTKGFAHGLNLWGDVFGYTGEQDRDGHIGVFDYGISGYGLVVGADTGLADHFRLGFGVGYGNSDIDLSHRHSSGNADSIQLMTYGTYTGTATPWYIDGALTLAWHNYEIDRRINANGLDRTAHAEFDAVQFTAKVAAGYPFALGQNTTLTPIAGLTYNRLNFDKYTETGAGAANLYVDDSGHDRFGAELGFKLAHLFQVGDHTTLKPEVHAFYRPEFGGDGDVTTHFVEGGPNFKIKPADNRDVFNFGLGVTMLSQNDFSLQAAYDAELRDNYLGHAGMIRLNVKF